VRRGSEAGEISAADVRRSHIDDAQATLVVGDVGGSVLAVGCLYGETDGLLLIGGVRVPMPGYAVIATRATAA
jgi:hypothetical protein